MDRFEMCQFQIKVMTLYQLRCRKILQLLTVKTKSELLVVTLCMFSMSQRSSQYLCETQNYVEVGSCMSMLEWEITLCMMCRVTSMRSGSLHKISLSHCVPSSHQVPCYNKVNTIIFQDGIDVRYIWSLHVLVISDICCGVIIRNKASVMIIGRS